MSNPDRPNVALIVLDTLRKDRFDEFFDWLPGTTYTNAWSTSRRTTPAHASLFTGSYPSTIGVHSKQPRLVTDESTVVEDLENAGYRTRALSSNPYISQEFNYDRGFEKFQYIDSVSDFWVDAIPSDIKGYSRYLSAIRAATAANQSTVKLLKGGFRRKFGSHLPIIKEADWGADEILTEISEMEFKKANEFLFLNFMETHSPYVPPSSYQSCESKTPNASIATVTKNYQADLDLVKRSYDDCARYLSDKYSEIFQILIDNFDYIITLADHGESLGEEGIWGHCCGVYPQLTHIPLSIYAGEDIANPIKTDSPVNLIDIYWTLMDIGIGNTKARSRRSLVRQGRTYNRRTRTETIGMAKGIPKMLEKQGISEERIELFDSDLYGFATESGYCYQTVTSNVTCQGQVPYNNKTELNHFSVDWVRRGQNVDISNEIVEDLEHLGYV